MPKKQNYMDENFSQEERNGIPTHYSYQKLKLPHCKTNQGLRALSYIGSSLWNNQDKSSKTSASLNAFKRNIKDYYSRKGNKKRVIGYNSTINYLSILSK